MMVDASVTSADIAYPTDLSLLTLGRDKFEEIIDVLYESLRGQCRNPERTGRMPIVTILTQRNDESSLKT